MKKVLALMFALALTVPMSSFAFAQGTTGGDKDKKADKSDKKASKKKAATKGKKADKKDDTKKDDTGK